MKTIIRISVYPKSNTKSKKMIRNKEKFMNDVVSYKGKKYRIAKVRSIRKLG